MTDTSEAKRRDYLQELKDLEAFTWDRELADARKSGDPERIIRAINEVEQRGGRRWEPVELTSG